MGASQVLRPAAAVGETAVHNTQRSGRGCVPGKPDLQTAPRPRSAALPDRCPFLPEDNHVSGGEST